MDLDANMMKHMPYIGKVLSVLSYGNNNIDCDRVKLFLEQLNIKYDVDDTTINKIRDLYCGASEQNNINDYDICTQQLLSFMVESKIDLTFDNLQTVLLCADITDNIDSIYEQYHKKINDTVYLDLIYKYKVFVK